VPRIAYFDTFSGMSGDMTLGALLDAGLPLEKLVEGLRGLPLRGYRLTAEKVMRGGFQATRARVELEGNAGHERRPPSEHGSGAADREEHHHHHHHPSGHAGSSGHAESHHHAPASHSHPGGSTAHRHLSHILELIEKSTLPAPVRATAARVFERLAAAEAKMHGVTVEQVHFHEVGAVDSIVDITGSCLGLHLLGVEEVWFSPATVGTGTVRSAHGEIPLPAPATLEILRGLPVRQREVGFELTTPTGAALAATLGRGFGPFPPMTPAAVGYGAGDERPGPVPNLVRVILGEKSAGPSGSDRVAVIETNVDDMSPQWIGYLIDRLLEAGALDVSVAPIQMKKSRSAHEIRVLAPLGIEGVIEELLFRETTTFGLRRYEADRLILERSFETVSTPWGPVRIKLGRREGRLLSANPEYADLERAARAGGVPLKEVHQRALLEFQRRAGEAAPPA
jgi:uncharacterized protein (TIGR00299 family) protein